MDIKDNLSSTAPSAGQGASQGGGLAAEAKEAVSREVQDARDRLSGVTEGLRSQATEATGTISSLVSEQAERRKEEAADSLRSFAEAIRRAADELGERNHSMPARLVREAAHGLENLSGSLEQRSVDDMARSMTSFARQNPATFLAGCVIAGVAVGRFLIASGARAQPYQRYQGYQGDSGMSSGMSEGMGSGMSSGVGPGSGMGYGSDMGPGSGAGMGSSGMSSGVGSSGMTSGVGETLGGGVGGATAGVAGAGWVDPTGTGAPGVGPTGAGTGLDATREAGTFDGTVSPSSAVGHASENNDALGTLADDPEPTMPSDTGLGGSAAYGSEDDALAKPGDKGGRDGGL